MRNPEKLKYARTVRDASPGVTRFGIYQLLPRRYELVPGGICGSSVDVCFSWHAQKAWKQDRHQTYTS